MGGIVINNEQTKFDKAISYAKNNRIIAVILILSVSIIGMANLTDALSKISKFRFINNLSEKNEPSGNKNLLKKQKNKEAIYLHAINELAMTVKNLSLKKDQIDRPCPFDIKEDFAFSTNKNSIDSNHISPSYTNSDRDRILGFSISYEDIIHRKDHIARIVVQLSKALNFKAYSKQIISISAHSGFIEDYVLSKLITNHMAELFKSMLVEKGVASCRILIYGAGNEKLLMKSNNISDKKINQRIEIKGIGSYR